MIRHALPVALALFSAACATVQTPAAGHLVPSSLEARQAQTRTFEGADARLVLKAAVNALQDEGYAIRVADADLGLVTAVVEWQSRRPNQGLRVLKWVAALPTYGASLLVPSGKTEFTSVEANVNVTAGEEAARVRVSLVSRVSDREGRVRSVRPVDDPLVYQSLLARLDRAVYLQKEGL